MASLEDTITIAGTVSLHDLRNAIRFKEGSFWKFRSLEVVNGNNVVTFDEWDDIAEEIEICPATEDAPDGMTEQWRGAVRWNGIEGQAALYRG